MVELGKPKTGHGKGGVVRSLPSLGIFIVTLERLTQCKGRNYLHQPRMFSMSWPFLERENTGSDWDFDAIQRLSRLRQRSYIARIEVITSLLFMAGANVPKTKRPHR